MGDAKKAQKIIIVAGPPATGKTSVMLHVARALLATGEKVAVVKIDCIDSDDDQRYARLGIPVVLGLSEDICPDHFFAVNVEEMVRWSLEQGATMLIIETAGLCHRCAPGIDDCLTLCVVDCLSSIRTPRKIGPVLTTSDAVIITKGDIISQSEREVFLEMVERINPKALLLEANGLTGSGAERIALLMRYAPVLDRVSGRSLRHNMPTAICSYCMGETRLGEDYQHGLVYKMNFTKRRSSYA